MARRLARQLEGQTAVVTGAARGIGRGIANVLAERGARVVACDVDRQGAVATAAGIARAGGDAVAVCCDVRDRSSMDRVAATALDRYGQIDICVANAGVIGADGFEERLTHVEADWDVTFDVNVKGMVNTVEAVAGHMKERRSGRIVTIASQGGRRPRGRNIALGKQIVPYLVSKAAVIQWTHLLAQELGEFGITANCVCPGTLWTPMWERIAASLAARDPSLRALTPREVFLQRLRNSGALPLEQTPEDIGYAVAFFASEDATEITGQALNVNGGAVLD